MKFAIEEVAASFKRDTGQDIKLVFGSLGNFATQILQDAPLHLFLSADENFVYKLVKPKTVVVPKPWATSASWCCPAHR